LKVSRLRAIQLEARFADVFGGIEKVPVELLTPAAHFRRIPRTGQVSTLVVVESDDSAIGYGEAFGLPHAGAATAIINGVIAPALIGASIDDPKDMLTDLERYFTAMGSTRGAAIEALSGVDIALWDLKARAAGLPLATLLGGSPGPVSTYVSPVGFQDHPDKSARAARAFLDQGYTAIKLKVGRGLATDIDHIAAVRGEIGPDAPLYLDANCAYDVPTAIAIAKALVPYNIGWFEEPVPPDDPQALAEVRRASPVPVAAGENDFTLAAHARLVAADAVDFLQPNISRAGGVSGLMAIGALCARSGILMAPHGVGTCVAVSAAVHVCRAAPAVHAYEANRLLNPLRDNMAVRPILTEGGQLVAQNAPGHGGEPDFKRLARYAVNGLGANAELTDAHIGA
jgi:D-galactarolactone cycloisomerase